MKKILIILILAQAAGTAAGGIIKGPYLQDVTTTAIRVRWETDTGSDSRVDYGLTQPHGKYISGEYSTYLPDSGTYLHEVRITNLSAETTYHYMVTTGGCSSDDHTFRTAVHAGTPFSFAVYGDNQDGVAMHEEIASGILALTPRIAINVGDVVDNGNNYSEWESQFFTPARDLFYTTPFYVSVGNHEKWAHWVTDFIYFPTSNRWWSFDFGNAHFIILDTNAYHHINSAQYAWLQNDIAGTSQDWILVFFHHPPFSTVVPDWGDYYTDLVTLFEASDVDMVFNGHSHVYERSYKDGINYVTSSGGGGGLGSPWYPNPYLVYLEVVHHFCTVDISGGALLMQARYSNGEVFDSVSIVKYLTPTPSPTPTPTVTPTALPSPNYIELTADPPIVQGGSNITLSWMCDANGWGYGAAKLDVYVAAVKEPSFINTPCRIKDMISGKSVYLFGPSMKNIYHYTGTLGAPTFSNISIPPTTSSGSITLSTPSEATCNGSYVFAAVLIRKDTGTFVRTDGLPASTSNLFQIQ